LLSLGNCQREWKQAQQELRKVVAVDGCNRERWELLLDMESLRPSRRQQLSVILLSRASFAVFDRVVVGIIVTNSITQV
jgi:hypothetical protein